MEAESKGDTRAAAGEGATVAAGDVTAAAEDTTAAGQDAKATSVARAVETAGKGALGEGVVIDGLCMVHSSEVQQLS